MIATDGRFGRCYWEVGLDLGRWLIGFHLDWRSRFLSLNLGPVQVFLYECEEEEWLQSWDGIDEVPF